MPDSTFSRLIGGTVSVGLGNLSTMVFGLLGTVVVARHLPAEVFGTFILVQVVAAFLARISGFGLDLSISKFITSSEDDCERRSIINTVLYFRVFVIFVVSMVALLASPLLTLMFGSSLLLGFIVFVPLLFSFQSLNQLLNGTLQGFFLFKAIGTAQLLSSSLNFLLILILVLVLGQGVPGLVTARASSMAIACAFAYIRAPFKKQLEFRPALLKRVLLFGLPLQINDILTFVFLRIDTLMIGALLGSAEIAYYEIARKIPESLTGFYEAFRAVYFPFVSRLFALGERIRVSQMLNNSIRLISFASIFGALIALVFGDDIIRLLFSEKYLPSVPIFVLLMVGMNLSVTEYTFGYSLVAIGESDKPLIVNVVRTTVSLLGNVLFIPLFGVVGAACANVASNLMTSPLDIFFLRRRQIPASILNYLKPILVFAVLGLFFILVLPYILVFKIGMIALFSASCILLSVITADDLLVVRKEARSVFSKWARKANSLNEGGSPQS